MLYAVTWRAAYLLIQNCISDVELLLLNENRYSYEVSRLTGRLVFGMEGGFVPEAWSNKQAAIWQLFFVCCEK